MNEIKEKVDDLKLTKYVKFLGQRNDVSELYQVFDVFVLPSLYEGLPVVGVEAQASGLLCLFSNDMTKETKVLDSAEFLPLNENVENWVARLLKKDQYSRKNANSIFINRGFSIKNEAIKLTASYIKKSGR